MLVFDRPGNLSVTPVSKDSTARCEMNARINWIMSLDHERKVIELRQQD
jgi:hypothetical protein